MYISIDRIPKDVIQKALDKVIWLESSVAQHLPSFIIIYKMQKTVAHISSTP